MSPAFVKEDSADPAPLPQPAQLSAVTLSGLKAHTDQPPLIRPLDPRSDTDAVTRLYQEAADYVLLETGAAPAKILTIEFFYGTPKDVAETDLLRLGLFQNDHLAGIAQLVFGFPDPADAYIGLMLFAPQYRNQGLGPAFLDHLTALARARNAPRLLLAVLDQNPSGRAFWERMGFHHTETFPPRRFDSVPHIRHRMERPL